MKNKDMFIKMQINNNTIMNIINKIKSYITMCLDDNISIKDKNGDYTILEGIGYNDNRLELYLNNKSVICLDNTFYIILPLISYPKEIVIYNNTDEQILTLLFPEKKTYINEVNKITVANL